MSESHLSRSARALSALQPLVKGKVRANAVSRSAYASDASMYQIQPIAVVEPLDRDDAIAAVKCCAENDWPILPRGGGTSLVGQTVGEAVVIDLSTYCHRILELNVDEAWVRVEPGITRATLNRALAPHLLHFAPDPATSNRANIGGMIGTNAAGMRSIQYGMTIDHVLEIDLLLATGEVVRLTDAGQMTDGTARSLCERMDVLLDTYADEIRQRFPDVSRHVGGYPLDKLLADSNRNLAKLAVGAEGTLGVVLSAKLNLEPVPQYSGLCLSHFTSLRAALEAVPELLKQGPSAVELLDGIILKQAREHPLTKHTCRMIEQQPEALFVIEVRDSDEEVVSEQLSALASMLSATNGCYAAPLFDEPAAVSEIWLMRESALGLMSTVPGARKPIPYIEDAAVPVEHLADYVDDVLAICRQHEQPVSMFAHAGAGLLHIRPMHDLRDKADVAQMKQIQDAVFERVRHYGGAWSGEHGDGIIRGGHNRAYFGEVVYPLFREVKQLFDPAHLMNPGKIVDVPSRDQHLRVDPRAQPLSVETGFRWKNPNGWLGATEQCTGIGACRKIKSGLMCPSYMATRDELHSTRGRANVLRAVLSGELGPDGLSDQEVQDVFDLCLACKGCTTECPNKVDVGKMKAELLYQHYQKHRRPVRSRLFAAPGRVGRWSAGVAAPLLNACLRNRAVRLILDRLLGISRERVLPAFTSRPLSRRIDPLTDQATVLLFNDIYSEYHQPAIGEAAIALLQAAGHRVALSKPLDSQRAAISQGMLDVARHGAAKLYRELMPHVAVGRRILVIEPSCYSALTQDLLELVEDKATAQQVADHVISVEAFLAKDAGVGKLLKSLSPSVSEVFLHVHCHQQAIDQGRAMCALLELIPGLRVRLSQAGCCGMAGAFGYEKEHYDLSVQIAEDRLLPALRELEPDVPVLVTGFSCRCQIADLSGRQVQHPLEWIHKLMS